MSTGPIGIGVTERDAEDGLGVEHREAESLAAGEDGEVALVARARDVGDGLRGGGCFCGAHAASSISRPEASALASSV